MIISIIAAVAADGAIGRHGDLVYHIREDMRHFRRLTMGHPVLMGRKTFESLPGGALPGRRNIVVTRNGAYTAPDIETYPSLDAAFEALRDAEEVFVIGGGEIYRQAMPQASRLYITQIDATVDDADTYFPTIEADKWRMDEQTSWATDPGSGLRYRMVCFSRI